MPTFSPGEERTARVTVRNPTATAFDYVGRLYLDTQQMAEVSFHLEADEQKDVLFPVTMPAEEGTYSVSIDVLVEGEVIAAYKATEDVEIIAPKPAFAIERLFVVTIPVADDGDFEVHCHIKNVGAFRGTGRLSCVGQIFIGGGQLTRDIDETQEFTLEPGQVYDYSYSWYSFRGDDAWVKIIGDWGEETPVMRFKVGFAYGTAVEVELECTDAGANYAILRYTQRSICDTWDFRCRTPPPPADREQLVSYPRLKLAEKWPTIYHAMLGLLPGRTYEGYCLGGSAGAAWRSDRTTFNT